MSNKENNNEYQLKRVGIIGGGKGGTALLQALSSIPQVQVVGVCDIDTQAPAIAIAAKQGIKTYSDTGQLIGEQVMDWLFNVAHRSVIQRHILSRELNDVTIIDGHIAELIWRLLLDFEEIFEEVSDDETGAEDKTSVNSLEWTVIQRIVNIAQPVHRELEDIAFHDPLTGLYSRHMLREFIEREISRTYRQERPLAMVVMDIDHFKDVNDAFGHDAGDQVLKELAQLFRDSCRRSDMAARYGGEEFVAVLPNTDLKSAELWAERMRAKTADKLRKPDGTSVTISLGVAGIEFNATPSEDEVGHLNPEELFKEADKVLYKAKNTGRNRVSSVRLAVLARGGELNSPPTNI
ncbi:MAG: diguanylate cyclase (GGDEF)-like protein [Planctomycetota bacterium]|jgi:diguanylate cyclase (GGDEF)-like protein